MAITRDYAWLDTKGLENNLDRMRGPRVMCLLRTAGPSSICPPSGQVVPPWVRGYRIAVLSSVAILSTKTTVFYKEVP